MKKWEYKVLQSIESRILDKELRLENWVLFDRCIDGDLIFRRDAIKAKELPLKTKKNIVK